MLSYLKLSLNYSFSNLYREGENEYPVMVELRSPELGNLIQDREPEPIDDPVSVSSIKLTTGSNFWTRALKKPISNWRDHYIRSSRMSLLNDDMLYPVQGPIL